MVPQQENGDAYPEASGPTHFVVKPQRDAIVVLCWDLTTECINPRHIKTGPVLLNAVPAPFFIEKQTS